MSIKISIPLPLIIGAAAVLLLIRSGLDILPAVVAGFLVWGLLAWLEEQPSG